MIDKATDNLRDAGISNVEWLHAAADAIPLPDNSVDIVTANGIYNLSPDKDTVIHEVARVLKPGGRTIFAEIVLTAELSVDTRKDISDWFRCIGGALVERDLVERLTKSGLMNAEVLSIGRNARTGHELARCAVIRATKSTSVDRSPSLQFINVSELKSLFRQRSAIHVIDLRTPEEFASGHVDGAVNTVADQLDANVSQLPTDAIVITVCSKGGSRSCSAAAHLQRSGRHSVFVLQGGFIAWSQESTG
jgi:rhodanese-related sulfurtransferase